MRTGFWAIVILAVGVWDSRRAHQKKQKVKVEVEERDGLLVAKVDGRVVRARGTFDEVAAAFDPSRTIEKPPLPENLDIDTLPYYEGGCPHCRKMSLWGENTWRYQVLSCTRERWDNTTTFLSRCKSCLGMMRSTIDHNDS